MNSKNKQSILVFILCLILLITACTRRVKLSTLDVDIVNESQYPLVIISNLNHHKQSDMNFTYDYIQTGKRTSVDLNTVPVGYRYYTPLQNIYVFNEAACVERFPITPGILQTITEKTLEQVLSTCAVKKNLFKA